VHPEQGIGIRGFFEPIFAYSGLRPLHPEQGIGIREFFEPIFVHFYVKLNCELTV
jgi:hypothetical protein